VINEINKEERFMKFSSIMGAAVAVTAFFVVGATQASTLDDVKAAGNLKCGINTGLPGFAFTDDKGNWKGFDVAFCRALAAAVLGNPDKVKYVNLTGKTRFPALASGEIDVLSRNTTWTFSRDVDLGFTFLGVSYYDGQGFIGRKSLGIKSAKELNGASVCIQTGTTTELNLADFFRSNNMKYEPVPIETNSEARAGYLAERCDVYTTDASGLAATKSTFEDADKHMVFPEINRMLGKEGSMGKMLGLDAEWAVRAIAAGGNYSEIFAKYLGTNTPLGLSRGLNALYKDGGILYAPPIR
jgi:general L-amino acid transport system substrate-binding protein